MWASCFFRCGRKGLRDNHRRLTVLGVILLMIPILGNIAQAQQLSWVKKAGGTGSDVALPQAIAVDGSGNSYVAGSFTGTATFGAGETNQTTLNTSSSGTWDIFVAKYGTDGTLAWAKKAGGTSDDYAAGIAVDGNGKIYVTGLFNGPATFGAGETNQTTLNTSIGSWDIFVANYGTDGTLTWVKQAGGSGDVLWPTPAVDGNGNIYVTGSFIGTATFFEGASQTTLTSTGQNDMFLAKYTTDGTLTWVKQAGGSGGVGNVGIPVIAGNGSGNSYVTGSFTGTVTFGVGETNQTTLTSTGPANMFVAKYGTDGTLVWAKQAEANGWVIAVDGSGNSYITGVFAGTATFDGTTLTSTGISDVFVAKYGTDGTLAWAKKAGGGAGAIYGSSRGIAVDGSGNSYVTGYFYDTATFGGTNLNSRGGNDIFVAKYGTDGTLAWAKQEGGTNNDYGDGIAIDGNGNIYVTGDFSGSITFDGTTLTSTGSTDMFVAKYISGGGETPTGTNVTVTPVDPNPAIPGTSVTVTFSGVTVAGNTSVASTQGGTPPPTGFSLGDTPVYFEITTSPGTVFTPPITVCIKYTGISFVDESMLRLFHQTGSVWEDVTSSLNTDTDTICGVSSSLSPFVPMEASYHFVGFFEPVQNPMVVNLGKAGSSIPLKWQLRAEGGGFVSALFAVKINSPTQIGCSESSLLNDLVQPYSSGSSGLHYDFSSNQYIYTWRTAKSMKGNCYRFDVEFTNREKKSAYFQLW